MLVLFSIACFMVSFTDTYTALNGQKFWVIMMPFYGPLCFSLPCEEDKDRVYDFFYLKARHAQWAPSWRWGAAGIGGRIGVLALPRGWVGGSSQEPRARGPSVRLQQCRV